MGVSAILLTMRKPEVCKGTRRIVFPQPISANMSIRAIPEATGIDLHYLRDLDATGYWRTTLYLDDYYPTPCSTTVNIPTYIYQVRDDLPTH